MVKITDGPVLLHALSSFLWMQLHPFLPGSRRFVYVWSSIQQLFSRVKAILSTDLI